MIKPLSEKQRKYLRGLAHGRDAVVLVGQSGLSAGVAKELDLPLRSAPRKLACARLAPFRNWTWR